MPWERRRYRRNKVWVRVTEDGQAALDDRGLASLRYKVDDDRTYTVRPADLSALEEPEPRAPDPEIAPLPTPPEGAIVIYTDGACSGNPGPAGLGVVLLWKDRRREISRSLGRGTNNIAELTAILDALQAVKRPDLPVRIHTDSAYAIGVLANGHKVRQNRALVARIRQEMERFLDLVLIKVAAHTGIRENERADHLARKALRKR